MSLQLCLHWPLLAARPRLIISITNMEQPREAGQWVLDRELGSGSFATVWHATHRQTQQVAAVKEINLDKLSKKLQESLASEVAVLKHTQHHNVVCLLDLIKVCCSFAGSLHTCIHHAACLQAPGCFVQPFRLSWQAHHTSKACKHAACVVSHSLSRLPSKSGLEKPNNPMH